MLKEVKRHCSRNYDTGYNLEYINLLVLKVEWGSGIIPDYIGAKVTPPLSIEHQLVKAINSSRVAVSIPFPFPFESPGIYL